MPDTFLLFLVGVILFLGGAKASKPIPWEVSITAQTLGMTLLITATGLLLAQEIGLALTILAFAILAAVITFWALAMRRVNIDYQ